jgi:hypothetical protein
VAPALEHGAEAVGCLESAAMMASVSAATPRSKHFAERVAEIRAQLAPDTPVEVWFQDEMRVGQKNKLTYRWARKGSRPRAAHDQRTQSTYLFGAVCPERGAGAALVLRPATPKLCSFTSMRSQPKIIRALTLFSSSIKPGGMAPTPSKNISFARAPRFE